MSFPETLASWIGYMLGLAWTFVVVALSTILQLWLMYGIIVLLAKALAFLGRCCSRGSRRMAGR